MAANRGPWIIAVAIIAAALIVVGYLAWARTQEAREEAGTEGAYTMRVSGYLFHEHCPDTLDNYVVRTPSSGGLLESGELLGVADGSTGMLRFDDQGCSIRFSVPHLPRSRFYLIVDEQRLVQWGPFSFAQLEGNNWRVEISDAPRGD